MVSSNEANGTCWHPPSSGSMWPAGIALTFVEARYISSSIYTGSFFMGSFTLGLFLSITIYRLFFHRIRHFPGPLLAALSKLGHSYQCRYSQNHIVLERLHQRYGDFVRTGPSEITIFHPEVLQKLNAPGSKCTKSDWYDFLRPHMGITTIRDNQFHDQRRRLWSKAFATPQLIRYEEGIVAHARQLDVVLAAAAAKKTVVNFSDYVYWFSFDVMGLFALSRSFDMLHREEWHNSVFMLRRATALIGPFSPVPWLGRVGFTFLKGYWVVKDWHTMIAWCHSRMKERIQQEAGHDIAKWIIADSKKRNAIENEQLLLTGESVVAIVAGSDTVAPTLVFLFYELALHPDKAEKLSDELRNANVDIHNVNALRRLPYLNAVIQETMRYHPVVPTGGLRDTPPEGMTIGGTFIPGNTTIVAPRYILFRSELCFERANEWIPERWDTQPELVKDARSYLQFDQGRYSCLGKDLAMSEMLVVTALVMSRYRIRFAPGTDISRVERDMTDRFTATPRKLELVLECLQ